MLESPPRAAPARGRGRGCGLGGRTPRVRVGARDARAPRGVAARGRTCTLPVAPVPEGAGPTLVVVTRRELVVVRAVRERTVSPPAVGGEKHSGCPSDAVVPPSSQHGASRVPLRQPLPVLGPPYSDGLRLVGEQRFPRPKPARRARLRSAPAFGRSSRPQRHVPFDPRERMLGSSAAPRQGQTGAL